MQNELWRLFKAITQLWEQHQVKGLVFWKHSGNNPAILSLSLSLSLFSSYFLWREINGEFFLKITNCNDSSNHHISPTFIVAYHYEGIYSRGLKSVNLMKLKTPLCESALYLQSVFCEYLF